jgi:hypothetical protein
MEEIRHGTRLDDFLDHNSPFYHLRAADATLPPGTTGVNQNRVSSRSGGVLPPPPPGVKSGEELEEDVVDDSDVPDEESLGYDDEDVANDVLAGDVASDCDHMHFADDAHVSQVEFRITADAERDAERELGMGGRWQDDEEYEDDLRSVDLDGNPAPEEAEGLVYDENEGRGEYDDYPD